MSSPSSHHYDFILAGGGAAGLSLADHLMEAGLAPGGILILEPASKSQNDRTWCFWEKNAGPYEHVVHHSWDKIGLYSPQWSQDLDIAPYRYKMIRSHDFYADVRNRLTNRAEVHWCSEKMLHYEERTEVVQVTDGSGKQHQAKWMVNSIPPPKSWLSTGKHTLLQHFLGWVIETRDAAFDPGKMVFMDFRIPQHGQTRFCYVLPISPNQALVEFTVFSPALLARADYTYELKAYLQKRYQLSDYHIAHEEFGVIPMTDAYFPAREGGRVLNIGTRGGQTKPSTGYTFRRIQNRCQEVIQSLRTKHHPFALKPAQPSRFSFYDRVLLEALWSQRVEGSTFFTRLFQYNPPQRVLKFLDEQTHPFEESGILMSAPWMPFIRASMQVLQNDRVNHHAQAAGQGVQLL